MDSVPFAEASIECITGNLFRKKRYQVPEAAGSLKEFIEDEYCTWLLWKQLQHRLVTVWSRWSLDAITVVA
jgi:hypothetical protein